MDMISEKILFQDSLWNSLTGILSRPYEPYDTPIIIACHGFSSNKDRSSYTTLEEWLINDWIAIFRYDAFGHGESEWDLWDITLSIAVDGCVSAYNLLQQMWFFQIGLFGSSFGGCTVLNAAHILWEKIFSVGAKAPVSDYAKQKRRKLGVEWMKQWKEEWTIPYIWGSSWILKWHLKYGFYEDMMQNNVHEKASEIHIPVCIVHGDQDITVLPEQSIRTHELLSNSELHIMSWVDHFFKWLWEAKEANTLFVDFFQRQLWNP